MSSELSSHLPIKYKDLAVQRKSVSGLLANVDWSPRVQLSDINGGGEKDFKAGTKAWRPALTSSAPQRDQLSLIKIGRTLSQDPNLMSENANFVLLSLQDALCIGLHVGQQYFKAAGVIELQGLNRANQLNTLQKTEFSQKQNTASAITVFCAAAYMAFKLGSYKEDEISATQVEFHGVPETDIQNPMSAIKCFLFYLAAYLDPERTGLVRTDLAMVKMALQYCEAVLNEIKTREPSLKYEEPFTEASYQLDGTDFVVSGFDVLRHTVATSVAFKKITFGEIVGNKAAKHAARRLASKLACFDLRRKANPFSAIGGVPKVVLGFGKPGTGKTMSIMATATEIETLCDFAGLPFLFWPMPDNVVSTYQGGSAERAMDWIKRFLDDDKVVFGPIDDGENNLEDRTRQGVSAGVREVVGVFLRGTEGASAIWRDNGVIGIFTNIPEQIDPAALSRVQTRHPINGAETEHDFLDQDYLWWRKIREIDPDFIKMKDPADYEYMSDQALLQSMAEAGQPVKELQDERLREIYEQVSKRHSITEHAFFAALFCAVTKVYPLFSSRDVRNIQQAVQGRIIDFDLPKVWLENPDEFYRQEYDRKVEMLKDLMRENMKKVSFAEIRHEETLRYLNAMAMIAGADRERKIAQLLEEADIRNATAKRLAERT